MQRRHSPSRNHSGWKLKQRRLKCWQPRALIFPSFSIAPPPPPPAPSFSSPICCRWVLAECKGFGRHGGSVLPAGAEATAEARLGQWGRQRHRVTLHESRPCLWQVRTPSPVMSSPRCCSSLSDSFLLFVKETVRKTDRQWWRVSLKHLFTGSRCPPAFDPVLFTNSSTCITTVSLWLKHTWAACSNGASTGYWTEKQK